MKSTIKFYINDEEIEPKQFSDMFCMMGWEDDENTKLCRIEGGKVASEKKPFHGTYAAYCGDDELGIAVSKLRNLLVIFPTEGIGIPDLEQYDYCIKEYYFSSVLSELNLDDIGLKCTKFNEDWLKITWEWYENITVTIFVSFNLGGADESVLHL